jgi:photosystem II stability/assembly factor-like uncharacterized protein
MRRMTVLCAVLVLFGLTLPASPATSSAAPAAALTWELVLPDLPSRIWRSPHYETDHTVYVTTDRDLRYSLDDGDYWTTLYPQPPVSNTLGVSAVAVDPGVALTPTLFVARNTPAGPSEVYRSADFGLGWTSVFTTADGPIRDLAAARDGQGHLVVFAGGGLSQVWRSADGGDTWVPSASGVPESYDVSHVYVSPAFATDQAVYLTGFGPLVRSIDGGDTWAEVSIPWVDVARHVAFSPQYSSDHTLWVSYFWLEGSGDPEYPPNGVVRSTDGGTTWQPINDGLPVDALDAWILGLDVSPDYPHDPSLYAVERTWMPWDTTWDLYRSPDGGDGWWWQGVASEETPNGFLAAERNLFFLPTTAGLWRLRAPCWEWVVNGACESDTGWEMPITGATAAYSTAKFHSYSHSIRVGIIDGTNKYAYSSARQRVVLPGVTVTATLSFWVYPVSTGTRLADYVPEALEAAARGQPPTTPLAGDAQYVLIMDDGGNILKKLLWVRENTQTWQSYTFDVSQYRGQAIWLHFGVYNDGAGGITGMYMDDVSLAACEQEPGGVHHVFLPLAEHNWQVPDPPPGPLLIDGVQAWRLFGDPLSPTVYALAGPGLYRSDDGAQTWALMNPSPPVTESLHLVASQPDVLYGGRGFRCYAGGADAPMWKSTDGGQTWTELPAGLNLEPLAAHPTDPQRIYARGCPYPWFSDDGGDTWTAQTDDLFLIWFVEHAAPSPADDWQTVYIGGTAEGGSGAVIGSTNAGADWELLTPTGDYARLWGNALVTDPFSPTYVYWAEQAAFWGSHDGGTTWYTSTTGLEDVVYEPGGPFTQTFGLNALALVPSQPDELLLGTIQGVYGSADGGLTWTKLLGASWLDTQIDELLLRWVEPDKLFVTTPDGVYIYYLGAFP